MDQADRLKSLENPRESANILSLITFSYVNVLLKKGKKKELVDSDIYEIISDLSSDKLGNKLEEQWLKNKKRKKQCSLLWLLICCFGPEYLMWGVIQLCVRTTLIFIQPYALSKIVAYYQSRSDINDLYLYTAVLIIVNILTTLYTHNYQQKLAEIGIKVRTSITALIYRKALKLGPSAISEVTMGKIVTLITRDVISFENALSFINDIWIGVIHITLISYLIFQWIGWSVLAGVGFCLATIPLQTGFGLIVYSLKENKSWRVNHNYFHLEPNAGDFFIAGYNFQWNDGVFSVQLTDFKPDGFRDLYFHAMAGTHMYKVSTKILRNETLATRSFHGNDFEMLGDRGPKSQTSSADIHKPTSTMFLAHVNQNALGCWNIKKPLNTISTVQRDDQKMIYPSDVKISGDKVYVLTNTMPGFIYGRLNYDQTNFRVWSNTVQNAIKGTKCA